MLFTLKVWICWFGEKVAGSKYNPVQADVYTMLSITI